MADRSHLRLAGEHDIANDDPFAELTRIMGFDPRQPNRPAPAPRVPLDAPVIDAFDDADFAIDLEKELMGEFSDSSSGAAGSSFAPAPTPAVKAPAAPEMAAAPRVTPAPEMVAAPHSDFSDDVAGSDDADGAQDPNAAALEDDWFSEHDFQFDAEAEVAAEVRNEAPEMDAVEEASRHARSLFVAPHAEEYVPAAEDEFDDEWAAARSAGIELEDEHNAPERVQMADDEGDDAAVPQAAVATGDVVSEPFTADDIELEIDEAFDSAMAEIPMDLSVESQADDEIEAAAADRDMAAVSEADLVSELSLDDLDGMAPDEMDADFEEAAQASMSRQEQPEVVAPAVPETTVAALPERRDEVSLEDELNALLGNSLDDYAPQAPAAIAATPVEEPAAEDDADWNVSTAQEEAEWNASAQDAEWAGSDGSPETAFDVDDETVARDAFSVDHGDQWRDTAETPVAEASWQETVAVAELDSAPEEGADDLDFDEQAFDAAFSNAIGRDGENADAPAHTAAVAEAHDEEQSISRDDPYAALEALSAKLRPTQSWSRGTPVAPRESAASRIMPELDRTFAPVAASPAMAEHVEQQTYDAAYEADVASADEVVSFEDAPDAASDTDVPDIETIDVPEHAVALADDLDLPEFTYEEETAPPPAYDDIDAEFNSLLNEMNAPEVTRQPAAERYDDYDAGLDRRAPERASPAPFMDTPPPAAPAAGAAAMTAAALVGAGVKPTYASVVNLDEKRSAGNDMGKAPVAQPSDEFADMEFAYDPDLDEEMTVPMYAQAHRPKRRGLLVAAVVGGVAVLGGVGAFALSFGNGVGSGEPALVKADTSPIKVKPENPGGTTVPNQDNKVYDSVAGAQPGSQAVQEKLVTTAEEPIEIPAAAPMPETAQQDTAMDAEELAPVAVAPSADDLEALGTVADQQALPGVEAPLVAPSAKGEDRIQQIVEDNGIDNTVEVAAVAPRKVRTMIVKADGTLVAREDPAPTAPADQPATSATASIVEPVAEAAPQATGGIEPEAGFEPTAATPPATAVAPAAQAAAEAPAAPAAPQAANSTTPNQVAVAPSRPSDQPVNIVGEVKADQVAALAPTAAASGAWAMQIASQPSEAAAQSSYQDLLRRYSGVLEGRPANIVKAEIAGKGTFWRVRIPAASRNDAIGLCESYKAAGGNCFVSK